MDRLLRALRALELDDDQPAVAVAGEQVDAADVGRQLAVEHRQARLDEVGIARQRRLHLGLAAAQHEGDLLTQVQRLGQRHLQEHHPQGLLG